MTGKRQDLGGEVVANSSGRPGDDDSVRGAPPRPEEIEADPGGDGLGLTPDRPDSGFGRRSGEARPGSFGRHGPGSGTEDASVRDPDPRRSATDGPDPPKTRG
ncbi:hypothetical protein [Prosthecomicrobium sp. N25]|uniref:hypothetical protein n=1 Tax=Prosthecomicrobium sp. N25 TaxID=3129254 RepID=UPI003077E6C6